MEKLKQAQMGAMNWILTLAFFEKGEVSTIDVKSKQARFIKLMKKVNDLNWQFLLKFIKLKDDGQTEIEADKALPDFESIWLGRELELIRNDPCFPKHLDLTTIALTVNFYSMVAINKKGEVKLLKKAANNDKSKRVRP